MSDPNRSDIDSENNMAWVCSTLKYSPDRFVRISYLLGVVHHVEEQMGQKIRIYYKPLGLGQKFDQMRLFYWSHALVYLDLIQFENRSSFRQIVSKYLNVDLDGVVEPFSLQ
jgi:hypothetical protein